MSTLRYLMRAMDNTDCVVLDTETTGLNQGEIVQIAIIDSDGKTLLDTLVQPKEPIPADATAIHGITDDMVVNAPTWREVSPKVLDILQGKTVIIYNAVYDRKMMHQTAERWGMPKTDWKTHAEFVCAMEAYAEFWGDWNSYHQSYRWQRLTQAVSQQGLEVANAHNALGDCLMTLALCRKMKEAQK